MNGSQGIVPTVDLATNNNNGYAYPVMPMMGGYGYGNNGFFGGDGIWAIVLIALLFSGNGFGFGGLGGFGGATDGGLLGYAIGNNATKSDLSDGLFSVQTGNKLDNLSTQVSDGFSNNATNICNLRSDILTGNMGIINAVQDSKYSDLINAKDTQRDILLQTTQLENQAGMNALTMQGKLDECCCTLRAQGIENTQKILDVLNQNTIDGLRAEVNDLKNTITSNTVSSNVINAVRPYPTPSYLVSSPYQSIYNGFGWNNGFYGNGFYGNTIY